MNKRWRGSSSDAPRAVEQPCVVAKTLKYKEAQEHLLRRLAGALVLQWDALPDELQDLIIDQAVSVEDRTDAPHAREDIESFIRTVKTTIVRSNADGEEAALADTAQGAV